MIDHLKVLSEINEVKDVLWKVMMDVHSITPLDDDEHLEKAQEYIDLAYSALCREAEKQEAEHGKDWDTDIGDM